MWLVDVSVRTTFFHWIQDAILNIPLRKAKKPQNTADYTVTPCFSDSPGQGTILAFVALIFFFFIYFGVSGTNFVYGRPSFCMYPSDKTQNNFLLLLTFFYLRWCKVHDFCFAKIYKIEVISPMSNICLTNGTLFPWLSAYKINFHFNAKL